MTPEDDGLFLLLLVLWLSKGVISTLCDWCVLIGFFFSDVNVIKSIRKVLAFCVVTESPILLSAIGSYTGRFRFKIV